MTEPPPEVAAPDLAAAEAAPPPPPPRPPSGGFALGLVTAIVAAVVGGIIWAVITVTSDYRIGVVAVGIGVLVGLAIDRFGGGDRRLPIAGAVLALLGCLLGDLFADAHIIARVRDASIFNEFGRPHELWSFYTDRFRAFDAVFYAIAAYEGFQFGRRGVRRAQAAGAPPEPPASEPPAPQPPAPQPPATEPPDPATPDDSPVAP